MRPQTFTNININAVIKHYFIFKQASRYRQRFGGRRIPPPPKIAQSSHPDLIPSSTSASERKESLDENASQRLRILEMQLALNQSLSSLDINHLSIGVNETAQIPQDLIMCYSEGIQTDLIMVHEVETETRKMTLDSSAQCNTETLDTIAQTEAPFMKSKNVQTNGLRAYGTQTDKLKVRNSSIQTANKLQNSRSQQVIETELRQVDKSTLTEQKVLFNEGTMTENLEVYELKTSSVSNENINKSDAESSTSDSRSKDKSDSPPLLPDKTPANTSNQISFPFVSMFNPLAVRLPTIGTYCFPPIF